MSDVFDWVFLALLVVFCPYIVINLHIGRTLQHPLWAKIYFVSIGLFSAYYLFFRIGKTTAEAQGSNVQIIFHMAFISFFILQSFFIFMAKKNIKPLK